MRAPKQTFERARALRREMTLPEVLLWQALRGVKLQGLRFRRQYPIGPYVLDFYCPGARLAVEVDGAVHDNPAFAGRDMRRDSWLAAKDISVLRVPAREILRRDGLAEVLATIAARAAPPPPPPPSAVPLPRFAEEEVRILPRLRGRGTTRSVVEGVARPKRAEEER
jgi:very-short-patch-repair endonuclease